MPETDTISRGRGFWQRLSYGLSTKLMVFLLAALVVILGLLSLVNIRLHRNHLEAAALTSADRMSDVIRRSTSYYMLRNDREGLYHSMATMADEPGIVRLRIFDRDGRIQYSSDKTEINHAVDKDAEACYGCHTQSQPLARLNRPDRFRVYRAANHERVLAIVTPIENQPSCWNADCHAHPQSQQILGVLDTHLSLAKADLQLAQGSRQMLLYDLLAIVAIALLIWLFVWKVVENPLKHLQAGTERLAAGQLGHQIAVESRDELGDLAQSFNSMSLQLHAANQQLLEWNKTLEVRVEEKSQELKRAHNEVLHVETMASLGKMAAVVAHEINNPLSGILTYAKLLRKWLDRGDMSGEKKSESLQCLDLIASESRRCGGLVKNLLSFSRSAPMNVQPTDINAVLQQCALLVRHNLELNNIQLQMDLAEAMPPVQCDPSQIEQVVLALMVNAIDAMPRGGNLWVQTTVSGAYVQIEVRDDGSGIPPEILPRIFEPFVTTKDQAHGTGLGLAVSRSIIQRHSGTIAVQSEIGKRTSFTIALPLSGSLSSPDEPALAQAGEAIEVRR